MTVDGLNRTWRSPILRGLAAALLIAGLTATAGELRAQDSESSESKSDDAEQQEKAEDSGIQPEQLSIEVIQEAIDKASEALYSEEPTYTFHDAHFLHRIRHHGRASKEYQKVVHEVGNQALACWALLASGESYQTPRIRRRMNWVLSSDIPFTYDRGMRAQMLAQLPADRWYPWVRRDGMWLKGALTDQGNYGYRWTGGQAEGFGDHANGQYGALGLWAVQQAGYSVPQETWQRLEKHWSSSQHRSGGWAVGQPHGQTTAYSERVSGPMTAGGVAVMTMTERFLHSRDYVQLSGGRERPEALDKGLDWLNENFSLDSKSEQLDFLYYMWTIQQVGLASGHRTFNGVDWFREGTARLLNLQRDDGSWTGPKGKLLSTGFALLYLSRANDPLAISKLRFDGNWNNRPHDLLNFVEWASDEYEVTLFWQIMNAGLPLHELIESRMLYIASDQAVQFSDEEIERLRRYVDAGGLLVFVGEGSTSGTFSSSVDELARKLFGEDASFGQIPTDHRLYGLHHELNPRIRMSMIHNGVRPLAVRFNSDIAKELQQNDLARPGAFHALSNLYLYVTGKDFDRPRLATNYVPLTNKNPSRRVVAARVVHGGSHDPEPHAMRRLSAILANKHDIDLKVEEVAPADLGDRHDIAFLAATADATISEARASKLHEWLTAGGTLWVDAAGGSLEATRAADRIIQKIAPAASRSYLGKEHPVVHGRGLNGGYDNNSVGYRRLVLQRYGQVHRPRLEQFTIDDRPAIIFSSEDLTAGLAGLTHWGIFGYSPESATRLVTNGILHAADLPAKQQKKKQDQKKDSDAAEGENQAATETASADAGSE